MKHYKSECPDADQEEDKDADNKKDITRSKNDRKTSSKSQSRSSVKSKEKVALAAAEFNLEEFSSEEEASAKERVWISVHKHQTKAKGWLIDSGATRHMTPQKEIFVKTTRHHGVMEVDNHGESPVEDKGDI